MEFHASWTINDPAEAEIINEILDHELPDRAVGIVASAYLEDRLTEKVKERLHYDPELTPKFFKGTGTLAAFAVKIDLGHLMGVYSDELRKNLHTVRNIRNEFAHTAARRTFKSQRIADLCKNFTILEPFRHPEQPKFFAGGMPTIHEAMITPHGLFPTDARGLYVSAVSVLLGYLYVLPKIKPPNPVY